MVSAVEVVAPATQNTGLTRIDASSQLMTLATNGEASLKFIQDMGKTLADSRMLKLKNPQQGAAVILAAICEGTTPFQITREFHIMDDGGMSMKADVMLAKFNAAGGKHQWVKTGDDGDEAVLRLIWAGQDVQVPYSIDDAKRANLVKKGGNWEKNPGEMLRARATSKGVRMVMPGIVAGIYCPEDFSENDSPLPASESAKRTRSTTTSAAKTKDETVVDVEVEKQSEIVPFDGGAKTETHDEHTLVLMEIETTIGHLGKTVADIVAGMSAKNPSITSLDDLSLDQAKRVLENLRGALKKKRDVETASA